MTPEEQASEQCRTQRAGVISPPMPSLDRTRLSQQPRNRLTKRHPRLPTARYALILLVRKARDDRVERALVGRVVAGGVDAGECRHVEQRTAAASPPMVSIVHHKQVSGSKPSVLQGTPADVVSKHARRPGQARPGPDEDVSQA
jgi:hypothetical protein